MHRTLRDLNLDDLVRAAGIEGLTRRVPELRRLFDAPALALARLLADFDEAVARGDVGPAAEGLLLRLGMRTERFGDPVLAAGPRLYVANHPGLGDALALLSTLASPELRVVALDRPFLRALPGLGRLLLPVDPRSPARVLRAMEGHLREGGAVLTFPAGRIEPDPAWFDPRGSWPLWSGSTKLLARRVPGLRVQPLLVAGVRLKAYADPWLARWRRRPADREWTAAVLQLAVQVLGRHRRLHPVVVALGPALAPLEASLGDELQRLWERRDWRNRLTGATLVP